MIGQIVGRYEVVEELGRGGMATVYKAYHPDLGRFVALKVLAPSLSRDPAFVSRFKREATIAARLDHPNIVPIYDVGETVDSLYIALRFVPGETLADIIAREGPLPIDRTRRILGQIAEALDFAHARGVVHRDLKPANILVEEGDRASLTDFGIAWVGDGTHLTQAGMLTGTPEYMAPEQAQGLPVNARTDLYAFAIIAFRALTGRVPFEAETGIAVLHRQVNDPPPAIRSIRPDLPEATDRTIRRALEKQPGRRYASAREFIEDLAPVAAPPIPPAPLDTGATLRSPVVRNGAAARMEGPVRSGGMARRAEGEQDGVPPPLPPVAAPVPAPGGGRGRLPLVLGLAAALAIAGLIGVWALAAGNGGGVQALGDQVNRPAGPPGSRPAAAGPPGAGAGGASGAPAAAASPPIGGAVLAPGTGAAVGAGAVATMTLGNGGTTAPAPAGTPQATATAARSGAGAPPTAAGSPRAVGSPAAAAPGQIAQSGTPGRPSGQILFASARNGWEVSQIYVRNADGTGERQLTTDPGTNLYPDWSPDGTRIVFQAGPPAPSNASPAGDIVVMNADGSGRTPLTQGRQAKWPKWSPDGQWIVYADAPANEAAQSDIYRIRATGGDPRKLTDTPGFDGFPAWTPDGRIVFSSERGGPGAHLYVMNADGAGLSRITQQPGQHWYPSVSRDGRIAFSSDRRGAWNIFTVRLDGTDLRQITSGGAEDYYPTWSPDGRWIAFHTNRDGNWNVYLVPSEGGPPERLTTSPSPENEPSWRP